jgi:hypothetical protein
VERLERAASIAGAPVVGNVADRPRTCVQCIGDRLGMMIAQVQQLELAS